MGGASETATARHPPEAASFLRRIGERVRMLRARRGMTRRMLARDSGVSERYIAQLEGGTGNVSVLLLRAVADALGLRPHELLAEAVGEMGRVQALLAALSETELEEARRLIEARFGASREQARDGRIALIGLRGAGKSTLGPLLAAHRGVPFVELDREIEREAGLSVGELVQLRGQKAYRRLERLVLDRLLDEHAAMVLAAGGGIVAEAATFERLLATCRVVWLRARPAIHMDRVKAQGDLRPIADSRAAMDDLRAILISRESLYARADLSLDTSDSSIEESLSRLREMTA